MTFPILSTFSLLRCELNAITIFTFSHQKRTMRPEKKIIFFYRLAIVLHYHCSRSTPFVMFVIVNLLSRQLLIRPSLFLSLSSENFCIEKKSVRSFMKIARKLKSPLLSAFKSDAGTMRLIHFFTTLSHGSQVIMNSRDSKIMLRTDVNMTLSKLL